MNIWTPLKIRKKKSWHCDDYESNKKIKMTWLLKSEK